MSMVQTCSYCMRGQRLKYWMVLTFGMKLKSATAIKAGFKNQHSKEFRIFFTLLVLVLVENQHPLQVLKSHSAIPGKYLFINIFKLIHTFYIHCFGKL